MKGFLAGALGLIALQVALSTPIAAAVAALALPAKWAAGWVSPDVPLIPDLRGASASTAPAARPAPGAPATIAAIPPAATLPATTAPAGPQIA